MVRGVCFRYLQKRFSHRASKSTQHVRGEKVTGIGASVVLSLILEFNYQIQGNSEHQFFIMCREVGTKLGSQVA